MSTTTANITSPIPGRSANRQLSQITGVERSGIAGRDVGIESPAAAGDSERSLPMPPEKSETTTDREWAIAIMDAAPAMTESRTAFVGTFAEACKRAREEYRRTGRRTSVCTGHNHYWFHVSAAGEVDLNQVPPVVRAPDDCFIDARGDVRPIASYGDNGPYGSRNYWLSPAAERPIRTTTKASNAAARPPYTESYLAGYEGRVAGCDTDANPHDRNSDSHKEPADAPRKE